MTYTHPKNYVTVRAGRQILYESAGNNAMMDGVYIKVRPKIPVEISAFGGLVPFQGSDFDLDRTVFGGRIAYRPWHFGNIGVSYTGQRAYGQFDRSNLGVDYAFRYFRQVEFAGVLRGTDAPEAARLLVDFLVSEPFQRELALNLFVYPANRAVELPEEFVDFAVVPDASRTLGPAVIDAERSTWIDEWTELVLG